MPLQVINYFLQYISNLKLAKYNNYYCVQLMLHYLFVQLTDLLSVNRSVYRLYTDTF